MFLFGQWPEWRSGCKADMGHSRKCGTLNFGENKHVHVMFPLKGSTKVRWLEWPKSVLAPSGLWLDASFISHASLYIYIYMHSFIVIRSDVCIMLILIECIVSFIHGSSSWFRCYYGSVKENPLCSTHAGKSRWDKYLLNGEKTKKTKDFTFLLHFKNLCVFRKNVFEVI